MGGSFTRRLVAITAVVAVAFAIVPRLAPHASALAASGTTLPGKWVMSTAVDGANGHVFVALDDVDKIAVLDLSGNLVTTIDDEIKPWDMIVQGSHLYVLSHSAHVVDDIDTSTLTRSHQFSFAGDVNLTASSMVYVSGSLWIETNTLDQWAEGLLKMNATTGAVTTYTAPALSYDGKLLVDPQHANTLFEVDRGISSISIRKLNIGVSPPTATNFDTSLEYNDDVALSTDGSQLFAQDTRALSTTDFSATGTTYTFPTDMSVRTVATTSADDGWIVWAGSSFNGSPFVALYRPGIATPMRTAGWGQDEEISPGGLAFAPDGLHVFVVTQSLVDTNAVVHLVSMPDVITTAPGALSFGNQRIGTYGAYQTVTVVNTTGSSQQLDGLEFTGTNPADFFGATNCFTGGVPATLTAGASCIVHVYAAPLKLGARHAILRAHFGAATSDVALTASGTEGYLIAGLLGEIGNFGDARYYGDATTKHLAAFMRAIVTTPNGAGYWLLGGDGGIFTYGNAHFYGSTGGRVLNAPISGMAATPDGGGYWTVATDGGIFRFGSAHFYGSMGGHHLNAPIVGMARTPDGHGYWLVASDGGIFRFGNAGFYGSLGGQRLSAPVIQMIASPSGHGYWLLTGDGHVYGFGDAHFYGAPAGQRIVGMAPTPDGKGYWLVSRSGGVFRYGNAKFYGSLGGLGVNDVMGIAASAPPLPPQLLPYTSPRNAAERGWTVVSGGASTVPAITGTTGRPVAAASTAPWRSRGSSVR